MSKCGPKTWPERRRQPLEERFWAKVDRVDDDQCWLWLAEIGGGGYGRFYLDGRKVPAHRVAWELTYGQSFPEGMDGLHRCDNPQCVNPAHILPGTQTDNNLDAIRKGRWNPGRGPRKTHCKHGHPYDEQNTYRTPSGERRCRACARAAKTRALAREALDRYQGEG